MPSAKRIAFDAFTLDTENELLWKGPQRLRLRPKTFSLLRILAEHPGRLATKNELLNAIWRDCNVGDDALKHCIAEIRRVLDDDAEMPRFVETVHRRGYRFIAKTSPQLLEGRSSRAARRESDRAPHGERVALVGRSTELALLHHCLGKALGGRRQAVFISGDQGIGKTSLVDAFLETLHPDGTAGPEGDIGVRPLIARGQCAKSHGPGEAYMPVLEAFTELGRSADRKRIVAALQQHAPLWLAQLPSLVTPARLQLLQRATRSATRERMLREMAEAFDAVTAETTLILVLEDLHWSDYSTLDLIAYWAQRRTAARMLLLATYRPAEAAAEDHPLHTITQELRAHGRCQELPLPYLNEAAIYEYLQRRFAGHQFPPDTAAWLHTTTAGNPLFVVNLLDHLMTSGLIVLRDSRWILQASLKTAAQTVPQTIQQIIERQLQRCTLQEQRLLQAASVQGDEFSADGVAAALQEPIDDIAPCLHALARRDLFVQSASHSRYRFAHTLYQSVCYQLLPEEQRARYHQRIAEYLERIHRSRQAEFAAQLAMHYDRGQQPAQALRHYLQATEHALARYAGHEALDLATRGVELLESLPTPSDRIDCELCLQNARGTALMAARGPGVEEVRDAFCRARELFHSLARRRQGSRRAHLFASLYGLWCYHWIHAEYKEAGALAEQLLELAKTERNPSMQDQAHYALGCIRMDHGDFGEALNHLQQSANELSRCIAAVAQWNLGFPDQAIHAINQTLAHAMKTGNRELSIFANLCKARVHMERREPAEVLQYAQKCLDHALDQQLPEASLIPIRCTLAWALAKLGQKHNGLEQMRQTLTVSQDLGSSNLAPMLLCMFAELSMDAGGLDEGLSLLDKALDIALRSGMHHYDAEIHRLRGEMLVRQALSDPALAPDDGRVEAILQHMELAIQTARRQQAKSLELRATASLALLLRQLNRPAQARNRLKRIYAWFTEGFETADLKEAHALLQQLR